METRTLGRGGLQVSALGLGCMGRPETSGGITQPKPGAWQVALQGVAALCTLASFGLGVLADMTITIRVPAALRACCKGAKELFLSAPTVRAALQQLEQSHPSLYRGICDETGRVRRHVNVFVNTSHVRDREGLDTALVPGDVLTVLPAVSGG